MKILINALSGIGDALMFSPALSLLNKNLPYSHIDMLAMFKPVEQLYELNPNVNKIIFIDFLKQSKLKSLKQVFALRKEKYDVSVNIYPSNRKEYNAINFLIGAGEKLAVRYNHYSKINWDFLNNDLVPEINGRHNILHNFDLAKFIVRDLNENDLGGSEIYLDKEDEKFAAEYIKNNNLQNEFLIGFHAGSATFKLHINKRWDWKKYAELAKKLNQKHNAKILLFGTEKDVNDSLLQSTKEFSYIPEVKTLRQSLAIMKYCKLFVSNDSALMHLASGLHIPTVAIFGYTNYKELHPWKTKHIIVRKDLECSPCFFNSPKPVQCIYSGEEQFKCIKTIEVNEVLKACEKLINEIPGNIKA